MREVVLALAILAVLTMVAFPAIVRWRLRAMERRYGYDTTYIREMFATSTSAFVRFAFFSTFAEHREGLPRDAVYTTKIVAAMSEDCGPCTQLVVKMAEEEGVPAKVIRGVLGGREEDMSPDASLAFRFARAVLAHDILESDRLREDVRARWGKKGAVSLATLIASSRVYPMLKYGLGHGHACTRVSVAGEDAAIASRKPVM